MPTNPLRWTDSIVTRLIVWFCAGGLTLSAGYSVLEYDRNLRLLEVSASQELLVLSHRLQEVLVQLPPDDPEASRTILEVFQQDPRVIAGRLHLAGGESLTAGPWPDNLSPAAVWAFTLGSSEPQGDMDFTRPTLLMRSYLSRGSPHTIELLIDGPYMHERMAWRALRELTRVWLLLGSLALAGLLVLRRGLASSLSRLAQMTACNAPVERFERASVEMRGELSVLAGAVAGMLRRIELAGEQVRESQRAYAHLYEFAPAAMVSFGAGSRVTHANRRAADLLDVPAEHLVGQDIMIYVHPDDRPTVRRAVRRLKGGGHERCVVRMEGASGWEREVDLQLVAVHEENGEPSIRANLVDVTDARRLEHHLARHRHLLEVLADHMSEAILLVGEDGRIVKVNGQTAALVGRDAAELCGTRYDPVSFWEPLGLPDPESFRLDAHRATEQTDRPARLTLRTASGPFGFNIIPVHDETLRTVARLWVVQRMTNTLDTSAVPACA